MTYPAPSSRRRMIGFGAALLFGVSTLAITSSVATAGEPEETEVREVRFSSDSLWIDGKSDDRQYVLLGDPLSKVIPVPPVPLEVAELENKIKIDVAELTGPDGLGPIIAFHDGGEFEELAALAAELAAIHIDTTEETVSEDGKVRIIKRLKASDMSPEDREALEAKLEAKADALEAKLAARESEMDALERQLETKVVVLEKRIEENGAEIERIMEERFGPEFEARVEAQAAVVEELMGACEDAELATGETRIIERKDKDGETFRLACIEGDRANLASAKAQAAIDSHPGITAAEKAAFQAAAKGERRKNVMVFRSGGEPLDIDIEMPEPPEPPEAPEAAEAPAAPTAPDLDGE